MVPVALLSEGESAEIVRLGHSGTGRHGRGRNASAVGRMSDMGLQNGQRVEVLSNTGRGPVLLKVGDTRIAIGRGLAHQVFVSVMEGDRP
jgi:Fe2+ transport system protein FeoA